MVFNFFLLALTIGSGFRVTDILDALGGAVDKTQRKSDLDDKIPAVFAATLGASLIANAVLNKKPTDNLNKTGN